MEIPPAWRRSVERIAQKGMRKILVIGASDRGKSTYCSFLAAELCSVGHEVAFVDADVGQKDVGPPAAITLAHLTDGKALPEAEMSGLYFIGSVSPIGHFLPMVVGAQRMVQAARSRFVIIDTTGLIHGSGRQLKAFKIEALQPDVIVALERGYELESLLNAYRHYPLIRLWPSREASAKSVRQRQAARENAFRRYFEGASEIVIERHRLSFQRSLLFNGRPVKDERFVYAEQTSDGRIGVSQAGDQVAAKGERIIPYGFERGLLCGVADRNATVLGLAILQSIDFATGTIALLTPVPERLIKIVQMGDMHLGRDGRELRHGAPLSPGDPT